MITASVSLSPVVVALSVAENQVQQRITTKILTDQIKHDAEVASKIVTGITSASKESGVNSKAGRSIDFRA